MEIVVVRQEHKPWGIDGHLYINRKRICDTVEHPTRHLPAGQYKLSNEPLVKDAATPHTLHHTQITHGDGALAAIHGEIIVGQSLIPGVVTASQATYDRIYERLKKAFQRGTPVHLKVV